MSHLVREAILLLLHLQRKKKDLCPALTQLLKDNLSQVIFQKLICTKSETTEQSPYNLTDLNLFITLSI